MGPRPTLVESSNRYAFGSEAPGIERPASYLNAQRADSFPVAHIPEFKTITYEEADGVATVTLNRPDVHMRSTRSCNASCTRSGVRCAVTTTCAASCSPAPVTRRSVPASTAWNRWAANETRRPTADVVGRWRHPVLFNDPGDNIGPKSCDSWSCPSRRSKRHGLRGRRVLHARRKPKFIIAGRSRDLLRPATSPTACAPRSSRSTWPDPPVPRDHAAVAPRQLRANVGGPGRSRSVW